MRVVRSAVGDISSGDVDMAVGAKAILIAFNIKIAGAHAKQLKSRCSAMIFVVCPLFLPLL